MADRQAVVAEAAGKPINITFMKNIIYNLLILLLTSISCNTFSSTDKEQETNKLKNFFKTCESDIVKSVQIIEKYNIINNLTHLLYMNSGGKKYYLLERENISEMINAVTEGLYTDIILINNSGTIIYTMHNDDIFGKNINSNYQTDAISNSFTESSKTGFFISNFVNFPDISDNKVLFASYPAKYEKNIAGILFIQINKNIIENLFDKEKIIIFDRSGNTILYKNNADKLNAYYNARMSYHLEKNNEAIFKCDNNKCGSYRFIFNNIDWLVLEEK